MQPPCRPALATPRALSSPAAVVPCNIVTSMAQMPVVLVAQLQAMQSLQADLSAATMDHAHGVLSPRVPASAASEKCETEMSPSGPGGTVWSAGCSFARCRPWRLSTISGSTVFPPCNVPWMPGLLMLNGVLLCLQRLWMPPGILLMLHSSNQAVQWSEFFSVAQGQEESIS